MTCHFNARYAGRCAYCQGFFEAGDPIKRLDTPVRVAIERWDHGGTHRVEKMRYAHVACEPMGSLLRNCCDVLGGESMV